MRGHEVEPPPSLVDGVAMAAAVRVPALEASLRGQKVDLASASHDQAAACKEPLRDEQREHGSPALFWSADFWEEFWQSTLENWQSEFLQLAAFTIAATYLVMKGSSESPDSDEGTEAKLDAILKKLDLDPGEIESELPAMYRRN